jgi:threonine/homoserine/homoserine lactone efflux protein
MPLDTVLALISFAFVTSITPGPNNIMLTASRVNFGFARSIPHLLGIGIGFMVLLLAVGFGLGALFATFPAAQTVLKWVGALYMLWLAWRVATAGAITAQEGRARPMTFLEAAAFQWVNPEGLVMAFSAMALYPRPGRLTDILLVTLIFGAVNLPCVAVWAAFGTALRTVLRDPVRVRIFNIGMVLLLVASIVPVVLTPTRAPAPA